MALELRRTKGSAEKIKVTLSLSGEMVDLYRKGKDNGWDTPQLAQEAVEKALEEKRDQLLKKSS